MERELEMGRSEQPHEKQVEVWEITTQGTVWVWAYDRRQDNYKQSRVGGGGGGGSKKLTITLDDRLYNQEMVVDESPELDPFTNGMLRRLSGPELNEDTQVDTTNHLSNEDLTSLLQVRDEDLFKEEIIEIKSELLLRRLVDVAEKEGTVWQHEFLKELITERHPIGGTQKTVREMIAAGEVQGGSPLSRTGS